MVGIVAESMRSLLEMEAFSPLADAIRTFTSEIQEGDVVTILTEPNRESSVASAIIEAALLDRSQPYSRRFLPRAANQPLIVIKTSKEVESTSFPRGSGTLIIEPILTIGRRDHGGTPLKGRLSTTAQAAALAEMMAPDGRLMRSCRPWLLAGNWWDDALDAGSDPVWAALLEHLNLEGEVRLSPITELVDCDMSALQHIDGKLLTSTREAWSSLDMSGRAEALSTLALPQLVNSRQSTARIEELVWRRIMIPATKKEFHSSLNAAKSVWDGSPKSASDLAEMVLSGEL